MVVSGDKRSCRCQAALSRTGLAGLALPMLAFVIALLLIAFPAEAKKKTKPSYSPPRAAMVIDAYTGKVLHSENMDKPRFPASIAKVMTLYLLFEEIRKGALTVDSQLSVSAEAASRPPSKLGLKPGSTIAVRDAMYALVTKSANDAAAVIAENIAGSEPAFARMMTQKARAIGMSNTTFRNASGLPDAAQITTAQDLITLGRRMLQDFPEEAKIFRTRSYQYGASKYKNHNQLLYSYAGMEGMKTGFTRASGFNLLASCRRGDKHLIAVVLGGRSSRDRNARMQALLNKSWPKAVAFNEIKQRDVKPAATVVAMQTDMMPERNPAFHPSDSERQLRIAILAARKSESSGADLDTPVQFALAAAVAAPRPKQAMSGNPQALEEEEGDTDAQSPASESENIYGPYHVQVGSYLDEGSARMRLAEVAGKASDVLNGHERMTIIGEVRGKSHYRARFGQFSQDKAANACKALKRLSIDCLVVRMQ